MSKIDEIKGCWLFTLQPGQKIVKVLYSINPFEGKNISGIRTKSFKFDPFEYDDYSFTELMAPEQLSKTEILNIAISKGEKNVYGNPNNKHGLCHHYSFDDFTAFVFSNPMNDHIFCADVSFKLDNFSLELSEEDTKNAWHITVQPNQKILKLMKRIDNQKGTCRSSSTSYRFTKV